MQLSTIRKTFLLVTGVDALIPYITLGETGGVVTQSVPVQDDGVSSPISIDFPFGSQTQSTVYVCFSILSCIHSMEV